MPSKNKREKVIDKVVDFGRQLFAARIARAAGGMSAPHGRPKGRQSLPGAAQRRTAVTPSLGEGAGGRAVQ